MRVNERVKEAPAQALRAVFGGIGSLLFVKDKVRAKADADNSAPVTEAAAPESTITPEAAPAPETSAAPETTITPETAAAPEPAVAAEPTVVVEPTVAVEPTVTAEPTVAATTAVPDTAASSADAAALPLPNYDELTIASLRARLRNLTADQLTVLIGYEREHANRADVIAMFERRITKLNLGLTQALPKLAE